jgi:hypothetical protein
MMLVTIVLVIIAAYLLCGFVFAVFFISIGIYKVDEGAHGGSIGFRIIIIPGTTVFWPVLLKKWISATKQKSND